MIKKEGKVKKPRLGVIAKNNKSRKNILIAIIGIIVPYLFLLLILKDKLLVTPDLDRSDAFHFSISLKYFLWESLHRNVIPFWTNNLQGGFPLMAEGQIGALYLPNLLFLRLFDFTFGYNLLFVSALFFLTIGMFLLLKKLKTPTALAVILSFTLAFSGAVSFRWIHLNLIQTYSLSPLMFYFVLMFNETQKKRYGFFLACITAQMIFAGHIQVVFIMTLALFLWIFLFKQKIKHILFYICTGIFFALPQLIPTYMLSTYSTRQMNSGYQFAVQYSLPLRHILSFILPFPFGNVQNGTYPENFNVWGIFWENSPYMGIFFLTVLIFAYLFNVINRKNLSEAYKYIALFIFFVLLTWGSNSPFYFIFDIPPFSLFRTPAKYVLPAVFFLIVAASFILKEFILNKIRFVRFIFYGALVANIVILAYTAFSYHLFLDSSNALSKPKILSLFDTSNKYVSLGYSKIWHNYFIKNGWDKSEKVNNYLFLNNFLIPNSNLIYGVNSYDMNSGGLRLRRSDYINSIIDNSLLDDKLSTPSAAFLLNLINAKTLISSALPVHESLQQKNKIEFDHNSIYMYELTNFNGSTYYIPNSVKEIHYMEDVSTSMKEGYLTEQNAIIEGKRSINQSSIVDDVEVYERVKESEYEISTKGNTIFVLKQNWYPELMVKVDGKVVPTFKTNLIHVGVMIPKGKHTVTIHYIPLFFYSGCLIAFIWSSICLSYLCIIKKLKFP